MYKIPLFDLNYDEREKKAVEEVLDSGWLSSGPKVKQFEDEFSKYLGENVYSCAVANCTAALHMALLMHDIGKGDEVIVSGLTFVADLNVINLVGAKPVIADCKSLFDWNTSVEDIKSKITDKTKAVIIVHFAGYPCDMDEIVQLCKENNIVLIEDSAHAIGSEYKGQKCGTFGAVSCFSFFSNKNLSIGEGGMLVTKSKDLFDKANKLRSHGLTSMTIQRHEGKELLYDVTQVGLNYRIDEIRAALGIVQLGKLDEGNKKRGRLVKEYTKNLSDIEGVIIPWKEDVRDITSSYHIYPILLPKGCNRTFIMEKLRERGIQTSVHYTAFKDFSYYKDKIREDVRVANEISSRVLTLPLYPSMKLEYIDLICNSLKSLISY